MSGKLWVAEGRWDRGHKWEFSCKAFFLRRQAREYAQNATRLHKAAGTKPIPEYRIVKYVPAEKA